jgi:predicted RNase H-like HicB family nuclease
MKNPYRLRCYARPENDYILGICIDLDIAVRGSSIDEVRAEMTKAIQAYFMSLDKDNFKDLIPRPVPMRVMLDYYKVCVMINCLRGKEGFQIFCEQLIPKQFEVSPSCV